MIFHNGSLVSSFISKCSIYKESSVSCRVEHKILTCFFLLQYNFKKLINYFWMCSLMLVSKNDCRSCLPAVFILLLIRPFFLTEISLTIYKWPGTLMVRLGVGRAGKMVLYRIVHLLLCSTSSSL